MKTSDSSWCHFMVFPVWKPGDFKGGGGVMFCQMLDTCQSSQLATWGLYSLYVPVTIPSIAALHPLLPSVLWSKLERRKPGAGCTGLKSESGSSFVSFLGHHWAHSTVCLKKSLLNLEGQVFALFLGTKQKQECIWRDQLTRLKHP